MLTNDTWFMYDEQSRIQTVNADGFGSLNAEGADHAVDCNALPKTKFCQKHPAKPICIKRIQACEKRNAKVDSLRGEAAQAKGVGEVLKTDAAETSQKTASASAADAVSAGGDNTMTYVAIAGVGVLVLGAVVMFIIKKKAATTGTTTA